LPANLIPARGQRQPPVDLNEPASSLVRQKTKKGGRPGLWGGWVWKFHSPTVTDLNGGGVGGVPALFKTSPAQATAMQQIAHDELAAQARH
jgi:hypothetical protein